MRGYATRAQQGSTVGISGNTILNILRMGTSIHPPMTCDNEQTSPTSGKQLRGRVGSSRVQRFVTRIGTAGRGNT